MFSYFHESNLIHHQPFLSIFRKTLLLRMMYTVGLFSSFSLNTSVCSQLRRCRLDLRCDFYCKVSMKFRGNSVERATRGLIEQLLRLYYKSTPLSAFRDLGEETAGFRPRHRYFIKQLAQQPLVSGPRAAFRRDRSRATIYRRLKLWSRFLLIH